MERLTLYRHFPDEHALDFPTWRSLVRQQGLDDEQAIDLMLGMVRCLIADE